MDTKEKQIGGGAWPAPKDDRDFSFGTVFGAIELPEEDFAVAELKVKSQKTTDYCTGYATTSASEAQEGLELNPLWQFAKTKQISGYPEEWGANIRDACKSAVKHGSIPESRKPSDFDIDTPRDIIANYKKWPLKLNDYAKKHKKQSYFAVDGPFDTFDNIRSALWTNRNKHCAVITGATWRQEWTKAKDGVIPENYGNIGFGHAFLFIGQKKINGNWHLIAHLSNDTDIGDGGYFYFPRAVVNKEMTYGNFIFVDMPREKAQFYNDNKLRYDWSWLYQFYVIIKNMFTK